jgi:hypothetical protein
MVKMKHSIEQDQRIEKELGKYRLAAPSQDLHDRAMQAAREALMASNAELSWLDRWVGACGGFKQEILAFSSMVMLILGLAMQIMGGQSVLADSIERLAAMATVSSGLHRATSMDCTMQKTNAGNRNSQYRVRWNTTGVSRVDINSIKGTERTLWISKGTISAVDEEGNIARPMPITAIPSEWQPPMEFLTPTILAQNVGQYGLMQAARQDDAEPNELLLVGKDHQQAIEIAIDVRTCLPTRLKKYRQDSARISKERDCLEEIRFQWNKPIPDELLVPRASIKEQQAN